MLLGDVEVIKKEAIGLVVFVVVVVLATWKACDIAESVFYCLLK